MYSGELPPNGNYIRALQLTWSKGDTLYYSSLIGEWSPLDGYISQPWVLNPSEYLTGVYIWNNTVDSRVVALQFKTNQRLSWIYGNSGDYFNPPPYAPRFVDAGGLAISGFGGSQQAFPSGCYPVKLGNFVLTPPPAKSPADSICSARAFSVTSTGTPAANFVGPTTVRNDFSVNHAITITDVAIFDATGNGLSSNKRVAIFDKDQRQVLDVQLLSSAITAMKLVGSMRWQALSSPVTLQPGRFSLVSYNWIYPDAVLSLSLPTNASVGVGTASGATTYLASYYTTSQFDFPTTAAALGDILASASFMFSAVVCATPTPVPSASPNLEQELWQWLGSHPLWAIVIGVGFLLVLLYVLRLVYRKCCMRKRSGFDYVRAP